MTIRLSLTSPRHTTTLSCRLKWNLAPLPIRAFVVVGVRVPNAGRCGLRLCSLALQALLFLALLLWSGVVSRNDMRQAGCDVADSPLTNHDSDNDLDFDDSYAPRYEHAHADVDTGDGFVWFDSARVLDGDGDAEHETYEQASDNNDSDAVALHAPLGQFASHNATHVQPHANSSSFALLRQWLSNSQARFRTTAAHEQDSTELVMSEQYDEHANYEEGRLFV